MTIDPLAEEDLMALKKTDEFIGSARTGDLR